MRYYKLIPFYALTFSAVVLFGSAFMRDTWYTDVILSEPSELEIFLKDLSYRESNHNQYSINPNGMLGLYQFSQTTLKALGYRGTRQEFLSNRILQDSMAILNLRENYRTLRGYIVAHSGTVYKGVPITTAGVLAAAHLAGPGSVVAWFRNRDDVEGFADSNGTSVRNYMLRFRHHKVIFEEGVSA